MEDFMKKLSILFMFLVIQNNCQDMGQAGSADGSYRQELEDAFFRAVNADEFDEVLIRDLAQLLGTVDLHDGRLSPVGYAVDRNNVPLAQLLLVLGANPNDYVGRDDETLLMIAMDNQNPEMFKTLLHYGADPDESAIGSDQTARTIATYEEARGNPDFAE